jgi:hypothetical protein
MPDFEKTSKKDRESVKFGISVGQWIYHEHLNNKTAIPHSLSSQFALDRLYGQGKQPKELYQKTISPVSSGGTSGTSDALTRLIKRKGMANQSTAIITLMPKIKSMLIPAIKNVDFDAQANAVDPVSGSEEEDNMMRVWMRANYGTVLDEIALNAGLKTLKD